MGKKCLHKRIGSKLITFCIRCIDICIMIDSIVGRRVDFGLEGVGSILDAKKVSRNTCDVRYSESSEVL